jgi:hypothetical protein
LYRHWFLPGLSGYSFKFFISAASYINIYWILVLVLSLSVCVVSYLSSWVGVMLALSCIACLSMGLFSALGVVWNYSFHWACCVDCLCL